jgi:hypothetical protein
MLALLRAYSWPNLRLITLDCISSHAAISVTSCLELVSIDGRLTNRRDRYAYIAARYSTIPYGPHWPAERQSYFDEDVISRRN